MKIGSFETHPAADKWPMLDKAQLSELAASIKETRQREPIMTLDGLVVDGRNRLAACLLAGKKPWTDELAPDTDPYEYSATANGLRRHCESPGQRAAIVFDLLRESGEWRKAREKSKSARASAGTANSKSSGKSVGADLRQPVAEGPAERPRDTLAKKAGVSHATAQDVITAAKDPEAFEAVKAGKVSPKVAAAKVRAAEPARPQKDELGNEIPEHLRTAWDAIDVSIQAVNKLLVQAQSEWTAVCKSLDPIAKELGAPGGVLLARFLHEGAKVLRGEDGKGGIGFDAYTLRAMAPHSVCLKCKGKGCPSCRNTGVALLRERTAVNHDAKKTA